MKKTVIKIIIAAVLVAAIAVLATVLIIHFQNKPFKNKVVDSLPEYESASIYTNEGDSELIKYGRYVYAGVTEETLSSNGYLKKIGLDELDLIAIDSLIDSVERFDLMLGKLYEKNADAVKDVTDNFDIDISRIGAPNYFYVETLTGGKTDATPAPETADEVYIYYFDIETQILYYMYANQKGINETVAD